MVGNRSFFWESFMINVNTSLLWRKTILERGYRSSYDSGSVAANIEGRDIDQRKRVIIENR